MTKEIKEYKKEGFFPNIDSYWQKRWESCSLISGKRDKKYILEMFPYPSGKIHMGHVRNYVLGDVLCRYFIKKGYDILHTMAWDAFGLPAENAARKNNINPADWTHNNISNMRKELQSIGLLYNWKDEFATCDKEYYSHQQKIFLDLYNNGLVYKKNVWVNWDPIDKTVLANEQVIDGRGWRSGVQVERKKLSQWMLKITDFADDLIDGLDDLDWNPEVLQMQRNWIGRSEGFKISFKVNNSSDFKEIEVYTTRPETIFGASCLLLSPDHYISELLSTNNFPLSNFINECQKDNNSRDPDVPKKGIFIDIEVVNPATGDLLPVFIANFVLNDHGTGAIFCCPAHDIRDFEFSKKYNLPIKQVVNPNDDSLVDLENEPYIGDGKIINSGILDGLSVLEAREKFKNHNFVNQLAPDGKIEVCFAYKLHDWCISRQRYWGCPIPIIDCKKCGLIPAKIPVILPENVDINFHGNPLDSYSDWKNIECHNCGSNAVRETDTMDTFVDSSWYFIRICSAKNSNIPFSQDDINKWMPVDYYIGGIEHAILHLLYSRFICRALNKCGYNVPKEPFKKLFAQGMVCHKTFKNKDTGDWVYPSDVCLNDGKYRINIPESYDGSVEGSEVIVGPSEAMSKSKCNLVTPNSIISKYGADTIRWFILSDTPPEKDIEWTSDGVETANRFMQKLLGLLDKAIDNFDKFRDDSSFVNGDISPDGKRFNKFMNQIIDVVSHDIEQMKYNCAIARIYEYYSAVNSFKIITTGDINLYKKAILNLIHLISPIVPHVAEQMWMKMGQNDLASFSKWPEVSYDCLVEDKVNIVVQVNSKFRDILLSDKGLSQDEILSSLYSSLKVQNAIGGKDINNVIYVQDKVINIITD